MEIETATETGECTVARLLVTASLANRLLQTLRQQAADGCAFLGGQDAGFPQQG
ncbi:MAG TPA: hypothetical protein VHX13_13020 [Acidobacteriaceae bacterium]|nr:hypothetical protein [Acidobacteriaceae bacterium]